MIIPHTYMCIQACFKSVHDVGVDGLCDRSVPNKATEKCTGFPLAAPSAEGNPKLVEDGLISPWLESGLWRPHAVKPVFD